MNWNSCWANCKTGTCYRLKFIAELGKKKVKLALADDSQWEEYFLTDQAKAIEIKKQIDGTNQEIDRMVYALYELNEENKNCGG